MIEGEIRVGDKFIETREVEVEHVGQDKIAYQTEHGSSMVVATGSFRKRFSRPGSWTPITPDTLPEEDVEQIFLLYSSGTILNASVAAIRSLGDSHWGLSRVTHWRPVPPEWLPLPTKDTP